MGRIAEPVYNETLKCYVAEGICGWCRKEYRYQANLDKHVEEVHKACPKCNRPLEDN